LYFGGRGYDGTEFALGSTIRMVTTETFAALKRGTFIDFSTTETGTASLAIRMRIDHDGQVGIGTQTPAQQLDVAGNVRVGTGTVGCIEDRDGDAIAGTCASDARFKRDVVSFEPMLNKVAALRPVHFYWRADEFPSRVFGSKQSYGLMAQEVEEILPELVTTDDEGYKAVNYSKLPLLALQAIRELKERNDALETQNAAILRRLAELEARLKP
jgi:hypothetical protein